MIKYLKWLFSKPERSPYIEDDFAKAIDVVISVTSPEMQEQAETYVKLFEQKHGKCEELRYLEATLRRKRI